MNYAAYGEHQAHVAQARDAAGRRFAHLKNAAVDLNPAADKPELDVAALAAVVALQRAIDADREMRAAVERANAVAPLCGQRELRLADLRLQKD